MDTSGSRSITSIAPTALRVPQVHDGMPRSSLYPDDSITDINVVRQVRADPEVRDRAFNLSVVVQPDIDLNSATVLVRGSLTAPNCDALLRIIARVRSLARNLNIWVDFQDAHRVDEDALRRVDSYPTNHVINVWREAPDSSRHGAASFGAFDHNPDSADREVSEA